jgi:hypothetical protein
MRREVVINGVLPASGVGEYVVSNKRALCCLTARIALLHVTAAEVTMAISFAKHNRTLFAGERRARSRRGRKFPPFLMKKL